MAYEIIFPVIHNLAIKHNELHKKYINKNDFENYFNSEYIPALRDFLTANSNNYIIWKTLHYNTVNLEDLLNKSEFYFLEILKSTEDYYAWFC